MKSSKIEKSYPELKGLPFDKQNKILESAIKEIKNDGKSLFWGSRLILSGTLIGVICAAILFFASNGNEGIPIIGAIVIVMVFIQMVQNHNRRILKPKVIELLQKDKFNPEINPTGR